MVSSVILLISLIGLSASNPDSQWSHHDEGNWPGMCRVGLQQSPINIEPKNTLADPHKVHIRGPLVYRGYDDVTVTARNTGYKVEWAVAPGTDAPVLSGGPLRGNYTFVEVHFHWLSEHTMDGRKYPLEIHMVHVKHGLSVSQAMTRPEGIAVVGILVEVGVPGVSTVLDDLIPTVPYILTKSDKDSSPTFQVNIRQMFSPEPQQYYTYHGSLTTPQCAEAVTWLVMAQPTLVSHDNYKNITRADLDGINNDRAVQPLRNRLVYRSMDLPSSSNALSPSTFGLLAALAAAFATKLSSTVLDGMCKLSNLKKRLFGLTPKKCD